MELIPILSTIILVATISTFILAIGAYILYKVRERKGQAAVAPRPSEVKGEIVTPAGAPAQQRTAEQVRAVPQPIYVEPQSAPSYQRQPIIIQQQAPQQPGFTPKPQPYTAYRQPYSTTSVRQQRQPAGTGREFAQQQGYAQERKSARDSKFLKYTSEGYVPAKEETDPGELRWR